MKIDGRARAHLNQNVAMEMGPRSRKSRKSTTTPDSMDFNDYCDANVLSSLLQWNANRATGLFTFIFGPLHPGVPTMPFQRTNLFSVTSLRGLRNGPLRRTPDGNHSIEFQRFRVLAYEQCCADFQFYVRDKVCTLKKFFPCIFQFAPKTRIFFRVGCRRQSFAA